MPAPAIIKCVICGDHILDASPEPEAHLIVDRPGFPSEFHCHLRCLNERLPEIKQHGPEPAEPRKVLPFLYLMSALNTARVLLEGCELVVRDFPELLTHIDQFLDLKVRNDAVRSGAIGVAGALSIAHNLWLSKHPTIVMVAPGTVAPPQLPTDPAERAAVLKEIDETP